MAPQICAAVALYLYVAGGFVIFLWVRDSTGRPRRAPGMLRDLFGAYLYPLTFPYVLVRLILFPERPLK
jgi:hypothetical protein